MTTWISVVYGRTRRADRWWRAIPPAPPRSLPAAVNAVVAGGRDLTNGPRFLLAGGGHWRLVGVACQAASLSSTMDTHIGRPLYCFVGWFAESRGGVPDLAQLRSRYVSWAAEPYARWVGADWEKHPADLREPHHPPPGVAPWDLEPAPRQDVPIRARPPRSGDVICYPPSMAGGIWRDLAGRDGDFVYTVGWSTEEDISQETGTHATAVAAFDELPVIIRHVTVSPPATQPPPNVVRNRRKARFAERQPAPPPEEPTPRPKPGALSDLLRDHFTRKDPPDENDHVR